MSLSNGNHLRIGIDLGGTNISGVALSGTGEVLGEQQIFTPREDYEGTLFAVSDIVWQLEQTAGMGTASIGVGIPGSISPASGMVQNANSTWLNGRPLRDDLTRLLRRLVRIANDANCFVLSEYTDGAAKGMKSAFGVILGTGCGGGFIMHRRLVDGPRAIGGEWGHNPLPWPKPDELPGPACWCGKHGCMETWVCGPAMEKDHERATGNTLSAPEIEQLAKTDVAAKATLDRHASRLARGLAVMVNILDPEVIVLGGGLSNMAHLYTTLPELMAPYIFSETKKVDIRPPVHGPRSGMRGAARLWDTA